MTNFTILAQQSCWWHALYYSECEFFPWNT